MHVMQELDWTAGIPEIYPVIEQTPRAGDQMELRMHCAYNETRECFLGLEVATADLSFAGLETRMATLALKSGEGLWLKPYRGIPATNLPVPLDLIYLDENCRVIDLVESYPTFRPDPLNPLPDSILALPAHSIYSSQTQLDDQIVICVSEEMEQRLQSLSGLDPEPDAPVVQSAVLLREMPLWGGGPGLLELEDRSGEEHTKTQPTHEMNLIEPGTRTVSAPKNWLKRWWSPDPRKAPRDPSPGLAAYYWNGASPAAHSIRDISSTGLYVVTEERWYPGTLILMTLQRTEGGESIAERTISVQSRAVRCGNDGVGLQFVLPDPKDTPRKKAMQLDGVGRKELDRFLRQLKKGK